MILNFSFVLIVVLVEVMYINGMKLFSTHIKNKLGRKEEFKMFKK